MQLEISGTQSDEYSGPYTGHSDSHPVALTLDAFRAHLDSTGKICPRPWCWRRFYILFQPDLEPPWLSSWWMTSTQEKKTLFLKQMEYLACQTNHFPAACRFLQDMDKEYWLFE